MPEYSQDDVVYVAIVRSAAPKDGREVKVQMEAFREAGVEPVTEPHVLAVPIKDAVANHHAALVKLGFDWNVANRHFPVLVASPPLTEVRGPQPRTVADDNERTT